MRLQAQRGEEPELNLISLVDVVLLLVIFFMLSTTFVQESRLRVNLPEASATERESAGKSIVITVTAQGSYRVNERALVNNLPETLHAALQLVSEGHTGRPIVIRADARATHQSVVTAMDIAARLGFTQVNIATVSQPAGE